MKWDVLYTNNLNNPFKAFFLNKKYSFTIQTCITLIVNLIFLIKNPVLTGMFFVQNQLTVAFDTALMRIKISKVRNYIPHTLTSNFYIFSYIKTKPKVFFFKIKKLGNTKIIELQLIGISLLFVGLDWIKRNVIKSYIIIISNRLRSIFFSLQEKGGREQKGKDSM